MSHTHLDHKDNHHPALDHNLDFLKHNHHPTVAAAVNVEKSANLAVLNV